MFVILFNLNIPQFTGYPDRSLNREIIFGRNFLMYLQNSEKEQTLLLCFGKIFTVQVNYFRWDFGF